MLIEQAWILLDLAVVYKLALIKDGMMAESPRCAYSCAHPK